MHSDEGITHSLLVKIHLYHFSKDMNYQGSTCICRVPKAQVRSGTVVECVHCGMCLSFYFSLATEQFVQDAAAAAQTHRAPIKRDIMNQTPTWGTQTRSRWEENLSLSVVAVYTP